MSATVKNPWCEIDRNLIDERIATAIWPVGYTTYLLNPIYNFGSLLDEKSRTQGLNFIIQNLNLQGQNQLKLLNEEEGIFRTLIQVSIRNPKTLCNAAAIKAPDLACLAKKLFLMPASSAHVDSFFSN